MANKVIHEKGKSFSAEPFVGKWVNITLYGNDVGYAQVGVISTNRDYILFQFKDQKGIVAKSFVKKIEEVPMTDRKLKKQNELVPKKWDLGSNPYSYFEGERCDVHIHSTSSFEGNPGLFAARIESTEPGVVHVKENGNHYALNQYMITGMMETQA